MSVSQAKPTNFSKALLAFGALGLACSWIMESTFAYHTADHTITIGAVPVDVIGKTAFSVIAGFTAFAGAAVASYLGSINTLWARKQAKLARRITLIAFVVATFNLASYFGWARRTVEFPQVAASVEYTQAVQTMTAANARLAGEAMGYEEEAVVAGALAKAETIVRRGQRPTGSELPGMGDALKAIIFSGLICSMAAAYRLPASSRRKVATKKKKISGDVVALRGARR